MLGPVQYRKKPLESTRKVTRFRLEASWGRDGTENEGYGPGLVPEPPRAIQHGVSDSEQRLSYIQPKGPLWLLTGQS